MEDIRNRIREIRGKLRLSQGDFAEQMGVKRNTWSNIENGVNPCSDRYIHLVCLTFRVREEWLRNGTGDMLEPKPLAPPPTKQVSAPVSSEEPLPPDVAELVTIYQELVPLNQEAVLNFADTTLQAQRNTIKALENNSEGTIGKRQDKESSA
jgi:DNA-binding XRE family transcriptional regulator